MWKKSFAIGMLAVCLALRLCLGATGWAQTQYSLNLPQITGKAQAQSASVAMILNHDGAATIAASAPQAGDEVFTQTSTGDKLATSYKLTGAALGGSADNDWVPSATFIQQGRTYTVEGVGPSEITLSARAVSASDRANDAGGYSATIVLTVAW